LDDHGQGCYVCTECGLVASGLFIADEAFFDKSIESMSHTEVFENNTKLLKFKNSFDLIFDKLGLHDCIKNYAQDLYVMFEKDHTFKGRNINLIICAFIYIAGKANNYAINAHIFGKEYEKDVMQNVKFIENTLKIKTEVKEPEKTFTDKDIEAFICKYITLIPEANKKMKFDIIKLIPLTEFVMRKKEVTAIALIIYYKKDKRLLKTLSQGSGISELAIKSALRDIDELKVKS